jgi:hypothetical protein
MERLGITYIYHKVGNARATGTVETSMWWWERCFESLLRRDPARSLEELNHRAFGLAMWLNSERKHSRHGMSRFVCWSSIAAAELRELPEDREILRALAMRANEERDINYAGYISFQGLKYKVMEQNLWGKKVMVGPDVFQPGDIVVACEEQKFRLSAMNIEDGGYRQDDVRFGDFRSPKETRTEREIKKIAGVENSYPQITQINTEIEAIKSPEGQMVVMDAPVEKIYGRIQGKAELARRLGYPLAGWQMDLVERLWGERKEMTENDVDEMVRKLSGMEMAMAGVK